jgi:hypothetical protein
MNDVLMQFEMISDCHPRELIRFNHITAKGRRPIE